MAIDTESRPLQDDLVPEGLQTAAMVLNPLPVYPATGAYVLRLHRDARPEDALLIGRIQHVASGEALAFTSSQDLIDWLARHAASGRSLKGDVS